MSDQNTLPQRLRAMHCLLTVKEASALLHQHYITVYRKVQRGMLPHIRIGASIKIDSVTLAEWLEARSVPA